MVYSQILLMRFFFHKSAYLPLTQNKHILDSKLNYRFRIVLKELQKSVWLLVRLFMHEYDCIHMQWKSFTWRFYATPVVTISVTALFGSPVVLNIKNSFHMQSSAIPHSIGSPRNTLCRFMCWNCVAPAIKCLNKKACVDASGYWWECWWFFNDSAAAQ